VSEEGEKQPSKNGDDEPKNEPFDYGLQAQANTANLAKGDVHGVQAGIVNGNISLNGERTTPDLIARRATEEERDEVTQFVPPLRFSVAERALSQHRVVVLCGRGSGRSFAARRLLVDVGAKTVAELTPARPWRSVRSSELECAGGYIWEVDESVPQSPTNPDFTHCVGVIRELGSWLVIVLHERLQSPLAADHCTVELGPPPPQDVARSAIRVRGGANASAAVTMFNDYLAAVLTDGDPPAKATRAAELAIRLVQDSTFNVADALQELRENVRTAVHRWAKERPVIDFAMGMAVAVLENQPYDEVVAHALGLDRQIRAAELPEDKKLRPRRIFTCPKAVLLRDNKAEVIERDHPRYTGVKEETVRFRRQDWAGALLNHLWQEYPAAHVVFRDWMCSYEFLARFTESTRRAMCTITAEVPAHEPLRWIDGFAGGDRRLRVLAASILTRLADEHRLRPLVEQALEAWVDSGTVARKWTAAIVYGSSFGRLDLPSSLAQLERIARSSWVTPRYGVRQGMFDMLAVPDCRRQAIERLLVWTDPTYSHPGPRQVAHSLVMHLTGFSRVASFDPDEFTREFPSELRTLVGRVLTDADAGLEAVKRLSELALQASASERAGADLVRIALLITPDLRWWPRQRAALTLLRRHPRRYWAIQWILRVARRVQQATTKRPAAGPAAGDGTGPPDTS